MNSRHAPQNEILVRSPPSLVYPGTLSPRLPKKICLAIFSVVLGTEDDLEYYVRECGDILGVSSKLPSASKDAKHILDYIFHHVVEFKKLNQVTATPLL